jgi:hypothetical protein
MRRILLFLTPALLIAAGLQLHDQHRQGAGWLPQRQAITRTAAELHRGLCQ